MRMIKSLTVAASLTLSGLSFGEDMPFWGDPNPATNRTAAASAEVVIRPAFESRPYVDYWLQLMEFSSMKLGFLLLFR